MAMPATPSPSPDSDTLPVPVPLSPAGSSSDRRRAMLYGAAAAAMFALALVGWSARATSHANRHLQCPDCNCGVEGGLPPTSTDGAETLLGIGLSIFTIQLIFCVFFTYVLVSTRFLFLPSCITYVLMGVFVGSVARLTGSAQTLGLSLPNQEQFFTFILPPIMLEAGYSLNKKNFFAEALGIFVLAIPGTLISAVTFGLLIYLSGALDVSYYFTFWEAMTFGAVLSAVDPVATIAIFSALKVNKTLHFLVFGESVLNDAVAIVLYHTFSRLIGYSVTTWYGPIFKFLYIFLGSPVVGALISILTCLILKYSNLYYNPSLEFSFYLLMSYLPYPICDALNLSGILGILSSSILLAHYSHYNLSKVTQISAYQSFRALSFLAETFVFIYLGTALTTFNHSWHIMTIVCGILFTLASRALNIYPLTGLLNRWRKIKISPKTKLIMWFSGSLRGAIAWALSLSLPNRNGSDDTRRVVISSTLAIVLFTVIVLGGGMLPLLRLLRVEDDETPEPSDTRDGEGVDAAGGDGESEGLVAGEQLGDELLGTGISDEGDGGGMVSSEDRTEYIAKKLREWDEKWLKPFLLASRTRSMVGTNRTLQTLAVAESDRLTPHELGSMLESSSASMDGGPNGLLNLGEEGSELVERGDHAELSRDVEK